MTTATAHAALDVREDAGSVRHARRFVITQLARWSVSANVVGDAVLVASELVTNAVRHGLPPLQLELEIDHGRLWIAVVDAGPGRPRRRRAAPDREGGRGLILLDALGARWGTDDKPKRGKRVWCELSLGFEPASDIEPDDLRSTGRAAAEQPTPGHPGHQLTAEVVQLPPHEDRAAIRPGS